MEGVSKVKVTPKNLDSSPACAASRYGEAETEDLLGVTTGLAWTEVGGELLSIEAVMLPGKGRMTITGKLGDVMRSRSRRRAFVRALARGVVRHQADWRSSARTSTCTCPKARRRRMARRPAWRCARRSSRC